MSLRSSITDNAPGPFLPPGVTSSNSSESTGWVSPGESSEDESFLASPFTPEGLMPRKSADSLRRELKISPRSLEPSMKHKRLSGVAKILADMDNKPVLANDVNNDVIHRQQYSDDEEDMILPPPDYLKRRQPTFDTSAGSSVKSPMVSTSSFYSRQQDRPVAMSPVLQVGQARTAVGALVALREAANRHPNAVSGAVDSYPPMESVDTKPQREVTKETKKQQQQQAPRPFSMGVLPPRSYLLTSENPQENDAEDENVPYMPVNTPTRRSEVANTLLEEEDDDMYASPSSMVLPADQYPLSEAARKGLETSFCSRAGLMGQTRLGSYDFDPIHTSDASQASSKSSLLSPGKVEESDAEGGADYYTKFEDEEEFDAALMARKYRNQQMQKKLLLQQSQQQEEEFYADEGVEEEDDGYGEGDYDEDEASLENHEEAQMVVFDEANYNVQENDCVDFEEALVRRKTRNQRHEKEAYLVDVVARLRDNLELVGDIEDAASSTLATMGTWFVKTPMNEGNLMTGFSATERDTLLGSIDSILEEMEVAQPEEFILSPSKIPVMATTHDTLAQALYFCRTLIASAIPFSEKNKMVMHLPLDDDLMCGSQRLFLWKCLPELHAALGLIEPQSPDTVRGGGTSLFSLPEESGAETPHTSNVSLATSITSAYTPRRRRHSSQPARPQLILQQDGLQLRHTVEVVSSLLQKLSLACLKLKELNSKKKGSAAAQTYVRACDEIKKIYLQFLDIKRDDARALTEIFYLESLTPQTAGCNMLLAREVSVDEEEDANMAAKTAQVVALATALAPCSFPEQRHTRRRHCDSAPLPGKTKNLVRNKVNLFSPATEDMRSKATVDNEEEFFSGGVPYEFDDLRRQVGSYDRDDEDEQRDGPSLDDYGSRDSAESEWSRRMYQNVSLAASSIRSNAKPDQRE